MFLRRDRYEDTWNVDIVSATGSKTSVVEGPYSQDIIIIIIIMNILHAITISFSNRTEGPRSVDDVKLLDNKCVIVFSQKQKTTKPGSHTEPAEILEFRDNAKLCPMQHLRIYLEQTQSRRKGKQLFIMIQTA